MSHLLVSMMTFFLLFHSAPSFAETGPVKVPALFSKIFVPGGFDSNDHVQIVGEGMFKNTCYRHADTTVTVDEASRRISLGPVAYEYAGLCLQVILPFERVIDVGILKTGKWEIVQGTSLEKLGEINIRASITDDADDYLYAPVSQAFFQQKGAVSEVLLAGEFTSDCLSIDQVKVTIEPDVIVLQPIAKVESRPNCKSGRFAFSKVVPIDLIPKGRYLLHVRSMNGNAINSLVNVN
jgi:hypothetical protein